MVTLQDIADAAGVSRATVSVILNDKGKALRISERTRERVAGLAERLGYCRNELARSVTTGKTNAIGFLIQNLLSEHCARVLDGVARAAQENDFFVKVICSEDESAPGNIAKLCRGQRLAGVVTYEQTDKGFVDELLRVFSRHEIPMAFAADMVVDINNKSVIQIRTDHIQGGRLALNHLYERGRRSFLLMNAYAGAGWSSARARGFISAAEEAGLCVPQSHIIEAEQELLFQKDKLRRLVETTKATAVFCVSDYVALHVINTLGQAGIKVPEDVAVVGYGNLSFCDFACPAISSVEENLSGIGRRATEALLERIKSGGEARAETLGVELVARNSTGTP